jgi:hypothetical protein
MWFFISTGKVTICAAKTYQTTVLDLLDLGLLVAVLVLAHAHGVKQATCMEEGYELTLLIALLSLVLKRGFLTGLMRCCGFSRHMRCQLACMPVSFGLRNF